MEGLETAPIMKAHAPHRAPSSMLAPDAKAQAESVRHEWNNCWTAIGARAVNYLHTATSLHDLPARDDSSTSPATPGIATSSPAATNAPTPTPSAPAFHQSR